MKKTLILILATLLFVNCWKVIEASYGKDFNTTRGNVGLRIIDSTFLTKKIVEQDIKKSPIKRKLKGVSNFLSEIKTPTYINKITHLDEKSGTIIYEEDVFISGVSKAGVDNNIIEKLIFRYVFKDYAYSSKRPFNIDGDVKQKYTKGWEYIHEYPIVLGTSSNYPVIIYYKLKRNKITKKESDSILSSWNLKRLNY